MPTAQFDSFDPGQRGWSLSLARPTSVIIARRLEEVRPLLLTVEAATQSSCFAAIMISYEAAAAFDPALKTHEPDQFPLAWAAIFEDESPKVSREPTDNKTGDEPSSYEISEWSPAISKPEYSAAIDRVRDLIAAGQTYQVNFSFPMTASFKGDARACYRDLGMAQGAGFSAYLDLGQYKIMSLSPELFFERQGDLITTRPMKGTTRRGRWLEEDDNLAAALQLSQKDRAENVMIVDLLRNDLGKVSIPGTVDVAKLFDVERYETLWQMTSTVMATARAGTTLPDLMSALFPCGSITGAPKVSTMEIIRDLEPAPRHAFTGAIGFVRPGGDCVFNVAIRTLILDSETNQVSFGVGGGITIDSTAEGEYDECLVKASFLQRRSEPFQILETMLLDDGDYFLRKEHLARLNASAKFFDFQIREEELSTALKTESDKHKAGRWKIRLLVRRTGEIHVEAIGLKDEKHEPLKVALASTSINSADRFLFHKTTNRSTYDRALSERPDCDDVILWNEREEVTESTIANLVVTIAGEKWTPPRSSGLLAGTFRNQLIEEGIIRERVISKEDLRQAESIHLINSVRKWMPAVLIE
jgi:para-aminobenzoate synthetase/4-amino-4-deoxychorismate lyase